mgnify:CR=1 FL=1
MQPTAYVIRQDKEKYPVKNGEYYLLTAEAALTSFQLSAYNTSGDPSDVPNFRMYQGSAAF